MQHFHLTICMRCMPCLTRLTTPRNWPAQCAEFWLLYLLLGFLLVRRAVFGWGYIAALTYYIHTYCILRGWIKGAVRCCMSHKALLHCFLYCGYGSCYMKLISFIQHSCHKVTHAQGRSRPVCVLYHYAAQ